MPNYCFGFMYVRGYQSCVDKFLEIMQADYIFKSAYNFVKGDTSKYIYKCENEIATQDRHFFRVFEAEELSRDRYGVVVCAGINFNCAWSVFSCMMSTGIASKYTGSYYDDICAEFGTNHFGSTLPQVTKELGLEVEIWASEEGMGFMEHYLIKYGIIVINDEINIEYQDATNMTYHQYIQTAGDFGYEEEYFNECKEDGIPVRMNFEGDFTEIMDNAKIPHMVIRTMCRITEDKNNG